MNPSQRRLVDLTRQTILLEALDDLVDIAPGIPARAKTPFQTEIRSRRSRIDSQMWECEKEAFGKKRKR